MKRIENNRIETVINSIEYIRLLDFLEVLEYRIPVLFTSDVSAYSSFEIFDCYDINRGAENHVFNGPVIAHPPSKQYGNLRKFCYEAAFERSIIEGVVSEILKYGGIIEHPKTSLLWDYMEYKHVLLFAAMSLTSIDFNMNDFGFLAIKPTRLSIVSKRLIDIRSLPINFDDATKVISSIKQSTGKKELNIKYRSYTPVKMIFYMLCLFARLNPFKEDLHNDLFIGLSDDLYNNVVRHF